ncbi:putative membrane protein [Priestia megaterium]|jgi:hypothetical protein|uniref:Putative membrane protein n=1 Tax=Priestia megaterium (strain ATCC 14581 / DSM 32 / CCUG 1817 / JCM 2506 / NBRC 15308 / NCIMB 9376 / NCTC 10342 / NRRL B-14308 / VKM B-512 / Ford 19) TaxID=1348623 RepID=A0A0B6AGS8_PRIM2|nr:putative membrane protein [Priestia megaterium NBRC 15308 = ATCC 14581]KFM97890.1 putative membrane protein [Priestia megaterium]MDQ0803274.1 hypothetical protein [Priestia megaterium]SFG47655.1 hypothetical protein SAMN04487776_102323 [Priestia megaterium]SUV21172.1 Uncharacterised protein [Priestia megaterium]
MKKMMWWIVGITIGVLSLGILVGYLSFYSI